MSGDNLDRAITCLAVPDLIHFGFRLHVLAFSLVSKAGSESLTLGFNFCNDFSPAISVELCQAQLNPSHDLWIFRLSIEPLYRACFEKG